jgi:hypothetical protein
MQIIQDSNGCHIGDYWKYDPILARLDPGRRDSCHDENKIEE